jgi:hypothetical protein
LEAVGLFVVSEKGGGYGVKTPGYKEETKMPIEMGSMLCYDGGRVDAAGARHTDISGEHKRGRFWSGKRWESEEKLCVGAGGGLNGAEW